MNPSFNNAFDSFADSSDRDNTQGVFSASKNNVIGGQIISNENYGKKPKKLVILWIAVLVIGIIAAIVFIMVHSGFNTVDDNKAISVLEEKRDEVHQVENIFDNINDGEISFKALYQDENLVEAAVTFLKEFKEQIEAIDGRGLEKEKKALLEELKQTLNQRLPFYEKMEEICAIFGDVYGSSNGMEVASELMKSPDAQIANLAESFYDYYYKNTQIMSEMEKNNCNIDNVISATCAELYSEYYQNEEFLDGGSILAKIMKNMNASEEYGDTFKMSDLIDEILYREDENEE